MNKPNNYLMDMDGVLVKGSTAIPGAAAFIDKLNERGIPYLVLTNNPMYTPRDLAHRLHNAGLSVPTERIFTSALATAMFMDQQRPDGKAYVIGESGLTGAIHDAGYVITDKAPDYVVLGETHGYNLTQITTAIRLVSGRGTLHRHQPRSIGSQRGWPGAGVRGHGRADRNGQRRGALLYWQA